jgi:hypothetical protein
MLPTSTCGHLFLSTKLTSLWQQIEKPDTPRPRPRNNEPGLLPPETPSEGESEDETQTSKVDLEKGELRWPSELSPVTMSRAFFHQGHP